MVNNLKIKTLKDLTSGNKACVETLINPPPTLLKVSLLILSFSLAHSALSSLNPEMTDSHSIFVSLTKVLT